MTLRNDEHYPRAMTSHTSSSTEDDDWHSTLASSSMTTATDEPDVDAGDDAYAGRKSQDALTPTATTTSTTSTAAIPHVADSIASSVGSGEQDQKLSDGHDQSGMADAQRGARPGSGSHYALNAQGPGSSSVTSSGMADTASMTSMTSSARDRSPSPSITAPPPALRQSQHYHFTSPHTRVSSISSVHSASSSSHNPNAAFQFPPAPPATPGRRNGRRVRPVSLASAMSGTGLQGPMSPVSGTASPRSSSYYHHQYHGAGGGSSSNNTYNILNRPLPQTPTASVSGSRPASLQFFASPTTGLAATSSAHWEPQVAASLRNQQLVPRPLRLQPSPMRRDTFSSTTMADTPLSPVEAAAATAVSLREEAVLLRAHQAASRMSHRRQWEQHLSANEYALQRNRLESNEGAFEVIGCFLQRLAHAENDALLVENFPRSAAQQQQQKESMDLMRKETVEALLPLIAYGPSDPTSAKSKSKSKSAPKPTSFPAAFSGKGKTAAPVPPSKAYAPRNGNGNGAAAAGMPPTPPMSPYRHDPRRESGMSGITETSLNGGNDEGSTTVWGSVKRASALFSWGGGANSLPSPAQSTRFTSE